MRNTNPNILNNAVVVGEICFGYRHHILKAPAIHSSAKLINGIHTLTVIKIKHQQQYKTCNVQDKLTPTFHQNTAY
jgi:hypothetical protein